MTGTPILRLRAASLRHRVSITTGLALLLAPGCMLIKHGRSQTIDVQTTPPGATVSVRPAPPDPEDHPSPGQYSLRRKPDSTVNVAEPGDRPVAYIVTASAPGYKDKSVPIESVQLAGDTWVGNLIWIHPFFLLTGVFVDVSSGAAYELRPSSIVVVLEPDVVGLPK